MPSIVPVILSGGSGTRLWPMSRPERPKQMLALTAEETMLQLTASRAAGEQFGPDDQSATNTNLAGHEEETGATIGLPVLEFGQRGSVGFVEQGNTQSSTGQQPGEIEVNAGPAEVRGEEDP